MPGLAEEPAIQQHQDVEEDSAGEGQQQLTATADQVRPPVKLRRRPSRAMAGVVVGAVGTGIAIGAVKLVGRLLGRKGKATQQDAGQPSQTITVITEADSGTPGAAQVDSTFTFGSPVDPGTPTIRTKGTADAGKDTDASRRDQQSSPAASLASADGVATRQELAALKQQLGLLQSMQEENAKLRAFVAEHMATSEKMRVLESENEALKSLKDRLEGELSEARTSVVKEQEQTIVLNLSNGEELARFKMAVGAHVPRGRGPLSVYSADQGGGGRPGVGAASEDGALTVAGELVSKHGSNHTVLRTLASLIFGYQAPESSSRSQTQSKLRGPLPSMPTSPTRDQGTGAGGIPSLPGTPRDRNGWTLVQPPPPPTASEPTSDVPLKQKNIKAAPVTTPDAAAKVQATKQTKAAPVVSEEARDVAALLDNWGARY